MMETIQSPFLGIGHVTIPVKDLAAAERFYVNVLGGRLAMRMDDPTDFSDPYVSIDFGGDTRLVLFEQTEGQPPAHLDHPHVAISVRPEALDALAQRLRGSGIPIDGPVRLGPPGQAAVYFNDPFGNHLEFEAMGYRGEVVVGPPNMQALAYSWAG